MKRHYILPGLAVLGLLSALRVIVAGADVPVPSQPISAPAASPFVRAVAGTGIVEAETENVALGTSVSGVVTEVWVKAGDEVTAGAPIFKIDDRELAAEVAVHEAAVKLATANVEVAKATRDERKAALERVTVVADRRVVSDEERDKRVYTLREAEASLRASEAKLESERASLQLANVQLQRLTVRAPFDGRILQSRVQPGEFATGSATGGSLVIMGGVKRMHVRVDIDENDAWRVKGGTAAVGYVRGNRDISSPLTFVRIEPYVIPKQSLTGSSVERTDTRVLQVLYSFDPKQFPVFVGQLLDVFIEG